jgi:hypothetical protein
LFGKMATQQQLQLGQPPKQQQPSDCKQTVLGKRLTPESGLEELKDAKRKGRLACWRHLEPKLVCSSGQPGAKKVVLQCTQCESDLMPSNISNISSSHFDKEGNCKKAHKGSNNGSAKANSSVHSSSSGSNQQGVTQYMAPLANQRKAKEHAALYFTKRGCPSHVEDPDLKAAFEALGCSLMGECQLHLSCNWGHQRHGIAAALTSNL